MVDHTVSSQFKRSDVCPGENGKLMEFRFDTHSHAGTLNVFQQW